MADRFSPGEGLGSGDMGRCGSHGVGFENPVTDLKRFNMVCDGTRAAP